jgi:hypothetical protein
MSDVSALYALEFDRFARTRDAAFRGHSFGKDPTVRRIRGSVFCEAVVRAVELAGDSDLGFRFGAAVGGRGFGLLGIAMAAAPTLRHSFKSLVRWESLTSTLGAIRVSRTRHHLRLYWDPRCDVPGPGEPDRRVPAQERCVVRLHSHGARLAHPEPTRRTFAAGRRIHAASGIAFLERKADPDYP